MSEEVKSSSNSLKERLARQAQRTKEIAEQSEKSDVKIQDLVPTQKVPQFKKPVIKPRNVKDVSVKNEDESEVRDFLAKLKVDDEKVLNSGKNLYIRERLASAQQEHGDEAREMLEEQWEDMMSEEKRMYALENLGKTSVFTRNRFVSLFLPLDSSLQDEFIESYLNQDLGYLDYYNIWSSFSDIAGKIKSSVQEVKMKSTDGYENTYSDIVDNVKRFLADQELPVDNQEEAAAFMLEQGVEDFKLKPTIEIAIGDDKITIEQRENVYNLMQLYSTRKSKVDKKLQKILRGYLYIADILGIDTANISIGNLVSGIYKREKELLEKLPKNVRNEILSLKDSKVVKRAEKHGLDTDLPVKLLKVALLKHEAKHTPQFLDLPGQPGLSSIERTMVRIDQKDRFTVEDVNKSMYLFTGMKPEEVYEKANGRVSEERQIILSKLNRIDSSLNVYKSIYYYIAPLEDLRAKYDSYEFKKPAFEDAEDNVLSKCILIRVAFEWLPFRVSKVLISSEDGTGKGLEFFIEDGKAPFRVEINKKAYYFFTANRRYFKLLCNSVKLSQNGLVLTCKSRSNVDYKFVVGYLSDMAPMANNQHLSYKIGNKFIYVQNETIFQAEMKYIIENTAKTQIRVENILKNPVSDVGMNVGMNELSRALLHIQPDAKEYQPDSPYINIVSKTILASSHTAREYFRQIAAICVFLKFTKANIFRKRIQNIYYLPEYLATLTEVDKFPEIFDDKDVSEETKGRTIVNINQYIDRMVVKLAEDEIGKIDLTARVNTRFDYLVPIEPEIKYNISLDKIVTFIDKDNVVRVKNIDELVKEDGKDYPEDVLKLIQAYKSGQYINKNIKYLFRKESGDKLRAVNYKELASFEPFQIIYYKEGGNVYGFVIKELSSAFKNGDYTNKYTGNKFKDTFVQKIQAMFNPILEKTAVVKMPDLPAIAKSGNQEANKLWLTLVSSISDLEKQHERKVESVSESESESKSESASESESVEEKPVSEAINFDSVEEEISKPIVVPCQQCKNSISGTSVKTVNRINGEFKTLEFCCVDCLAAHKHKFK